MVSDIWVSKFSATCVCGIHLTCNAWLIFFSFPNSDSEKFDNFYETRIDELIKEASQLEQTLIRQKQMLKERLKNLTKTLALVSENES